MTVFAGHWGPFTIFPDDGSVTLLPGRTVAVRDATTTNLATLYTSRTKATGSANPATIDADGNLDLYAEPGEYFLHLITLGVEGDGRRITIGVDPIEAALDGDLTGIAAAVTDEEAARIAAVDAEEAARIAADEDEEVARIAADAVTDDALAEHLDNTVPHTAADVLFDNDSNGFTADDVQAAIEEARTGAERVFEGGHAGELTLDVGTLYHYVHRDMTLEGTNWHVSVPTAGQAAEFDVLVHPPGGGSSSIFDPGNEPSIPVGENDALVVPDITEIEAGSYLSVDRTQIGSGVSAGRVDGALATYGDARTDAPTTIPLPLPANGSYAVGDLLICVLVMGNTNTPFPLTVPSGWTSKALDELTTTGHHVAVLWKEATTSSEPGGTITPANLVNRPWAVATWAERGVLVTDAVFDVPRTGVIGSNTYTTSSTATPETASSTTTEDNDRGYSIYSVRYLSGEAPGNAAPGTPNPGTEFVDVKTARVSQVNCSLHIYDRGDLGVAGTVAAAQVTLAAGTDWDRAIMWPLALKVTGVEGGPGEDFSYLIWGR